MPGKMRKTIVNGVEYRSMQAACRAYNMSYCCVRDRIKKQGMSIEDALTVEVGYTTKAMDHLGNKFDSITEMGRAYGIKQQTLFLRLNNYGMTIEQALTTPVRVYNRKKKTRINKNDKKNV